MDKIPCRPETKDRPATREHRDGLLLVEYLMARDGETTDTNAELAGALGFWIDMGGGHKRIDENRYYRARNHVRDRVAVDKEGNHLGPCCGYQLHYRKDGAKGKSSLTLIDASGNLGHHAAQVVGTIEGWLTRDRQHMTETRRHQASIETLGDHALANGDRDGYRLCQRVSIEIEEFGSIRETTMAELSVWMETVR